MENRVVKSEVLAEIKDDDYDSDSGIDEPVER